MILIARAASSGDRELISSSRSILESESQHDSREETAWSGFRTSQGGGGCIVIVKGLGVQMDFTLTNPPKNAPRNPRGFQDEDAGT